MVLLTISTACFAILSILLGWVIVKLYRERNREVARCIYVMHELEMTRQMCGLRKAEEWPELFEELTEK